MANFAGGKTGVRIVVCGGKSTGKSSLIAATTAGIFQANVPPVLPPITLPEDFYSDHVSVTIIDTSSSEGDRAQLGEELRKADAVVLTYACNQPEHLEELSTFWIPELRRLEVKVPVVVAGCKSDLVDENQQVRLEQVMPIMQQFRQIDTCIECSAVNQFQIPMVFNYAQNAGLYPAVPLYDQESQMLKPRCIRALKRIFILSDLDRDGALSDAELNDFQVKCFQPSEMMGLVRLVQAQLCEGVNECGLTLLGFIFLHKMIIRKYRYDVVWQVLRKYGYDNDMKLADEQIPHAAFKRTPEQSVELMNEAVEFLTRIFGLLDTDNDNHLRPVEVDDLFSTAPECPWDQALYKDTTERTALEGLSLDRFLSEARSVENLIYIGYPHDPSSAVHVTRARSVNRREKQSARNVFQCFVFGPMKVGKTSLLNSFLGRPFSDDYSSTVTERYAVNVVDQPGGANKMLVLREIPKEEVRKILLSKDSLAGCNVAIFVIDSSDECSREKTTELLVEVAAHVEDTGYGVPCLLVAAKHDLDPFPTFIEDCTMVSSNMGIEGPVPISSKLGDLHDIFQRIVGAACHPHLSIPQNVAGRRRKHTIPYHTIPYSLHKLQEMLDRNLSLGK